jgi:hypothetical protein
MPFLLATHLSLDSQQVLHISNLVFLCFNLGCALAPTTNSFIAFRFLSTSPFQPIHQASAEAMQVAFSGVRQSPVVVGL